MRSSVASNSKFDISNNHFIINYASGADPVATIRSYLSSGYNNGNWNGLGIDSSSAAANHNYAVGYGDSADPGDPAGLSSNQVEIKYTLYGDANLDGKVDSADLGLLADNYGASNAVWDRGDFNYDGKVDSADLGLLAINYGQSAGSNADVVTAADWSALDAFAAANGVTLTDVPEPTSAVMFVMAGLGIPLRRRRA